MKNLKIMNYFFCATVLLFASNSWAFNHPFECTQNPNPAMPPEVYPSVDTYIEKDFPTGILYSHVIFREGEGETKCGPNEILSHVFSYDRHEFSGGHYNLVVNASESGAECGDWLNPLCPGEVTFLLKGESDVRIAEVSCFPRHF